MYKDDETYFYEYGLSDAQVEERVAAHADNCKVESSTRRISDIVKSNVLTYFNLVFVILAVLLGIVGAWADMLFLLVIIANTCIGIVQEIHSKKVLDKLTIVNATRIKTLREGEIKTLSSEELVRDDICIFEAGSQIPADAVVVEGNANLNESLITGEADEVAKNPGDILLSGSFVISGYVKAKLDKVGKESYVSKLTIDATKSKKNEQSEIIKSLNLLIKIIGILIIPIGISIFVQSFIVIGRPLKESITGMVAAVVGMIPEGLYLLSSVTMAVSTAKLAYKQVLVHDMKCIETLARVNVLCLDKTGTITEPRMKVHEYMVYENSCIDSKNAKCETENILGDFIYSMQNDNATMDALKKYFVNRTGKNPSEVVPFSPENKYSKAVFDGCTYILGAPECVLYDNYAEVEEDVKHYTEQGFRTIVFATEEQVPLALIALANPVRKGAREIFKYFDDNKVQVKVISGDDPMTVSRVAIAAGISDAEKYVDASILEEEETYREAVKNYTVFGRVKPEQKRKIVEALKNNGNTVAMTGDGVNDVLALKDADCSIALASGSEAACDVSQLVLMDSDFSRMKDVVDEGRRVVNNLQRTASLFLVKNIFSMLLGIFSVIFMLEYPFEPSQISLISMFTIGIPAFLLALEPNNNSISGNFLSNILFRALPAGVTSFLIVSGLVVFSEEFKVDAACISTSCTVLVAFVGFVFLYDTMKIEKTIKQGYIIMLICLVLGLLSSIVFAGEIFSFTSLKKPCLMLMALFVLATEPIFRYTSLLVEAVRKWTDKRVH